MLPIPKFRFKVNFPLADGNQVQLGFTEVSGLDAETEIIEYRNGDFTSKYKTQVLGLQKVNRITMKRGMVEGNIALFDLWKKTTDTASTTDAKREVKIQLMNEANATIITWTLTNAMLVKLQSTDLKADGNEIAIETAEWVHEGIKAEA